jgi:hypothetical protein
MSRLLTAVELAASSVSFRVVTPGGRVGSPEGRTPNVDTKFLTTFFLLISPISSQDSHSSPRLHLLLFFPLTQTQRKSNVLLSDSRAISMESGAKPPKHWQHQRVSHHLMHLYATACIDNFVNNVRVIYVTICRKANRPSLRLTRDVSSSSPLID